MSTATAGHDEAALEFPVRGQPVAAILRTPRDRPAGGDGRCGRATGHGREAGLRLRGAPAPTGPPGAG